MVGGNSWERDEDSNFAVPDDYLFLSIRCTAVLLGVSCVCNEEF